MKRAFKVYGWAWLGALATTLTMVAVMMLYPTHHHRAKNPAMVDRIVGVNLPDLTAVESEDNLDRGASRWDCFSHSAKFSSPISAKSIKKMNKLCNTDSKHWSKDSAEGCYIYCDSGGMDNLYEVSCQIYDDHLHISYMVDESEGLFLLVPLLLLYNGLIHWGIALCIIALVRWIINTNS